MVETRIHPETGKTLRRDVRQQTVAFGHFSQTVEVSGWYPDDDSDAIHTGADLKVANEAFLKLRSSYAEFVRKLRKKLKLTQEDAGAIIGGGRRAFQKYETELMPPSQAAIGLLAILERHPEKLQILKSLPLSSPGHPKAAPLRISKVSRDASSRRGRARKRKLA